MRLLIFLWVATSCLTLSARKLKEQPLEIRIIYDTQLLRLPGDQLKIGVEVLMPDSSIQRTRNIGGKLDMSNFDFSVTRGNFRFGKIHFNDFQFADAMVTVNCKKFPKVSESQVITIHREHELYAKVSPKGTAAPGEEYTIELSALFYNDQLTENVISVPWDYYLVSVDGGKFKNGTIEVSDDPRNIHGHTVALQIKPISLSIATKNISIPIDYKKDYTFYASSRDGFWGRQGARAAFGGHGEHGEDGQHGEHGPTVEVNVEAYLDSIFNTVLLDIWVKTSQKEKFYRINSNGGTLRVTTAGGDGGDGGDGGAGGNGRDGKDGAVSTKRIQINDSTWQEVRTQGPGQQGSPGGHGGDGGWGGDGGNGGDIYVYYNSLAEQYLHLLSVWSLGGEGGDGGNAGAGGQGGNGGKGCPAGRNGQNGLAGYYGRHGPDGYSGEIIFVPLERGTH